MGAEVIMLSFTLMCSWSSLSTCDVHRIDRLFDNLYKMGKLENKPPIFDAEFVKNMHRNDVYFRHTVKEWEMYVAGNPESKPEVKHHPQDEKVSAIATSEPQPQPQPASKLGTAQNSYPVAVVAYPFITYQNPHSKMPNSQNVLQPIPSIMHPLNSQFQPASRSSFPNSKGDLNSDGPQQKDLMPLLNESLLLDSKNESAFKDTAAGDTQLLHNLKNRESNWMADHKMLPK